MIRKIYLHSTYNCNANCVHCAVPTSDETIRTTSGKIPFESFKNIIDATSENGVEWLVIGGGEPLLHPNLMEMVEYAKNKGIKVKVETNGFLLDDKKLEQFRKNLYQLCISLDGANPQTHNQIRAINLYTNTTRMIKRAREMGMDVAIWSVVMNYNSKDTQNIIKLVEDLGANKISFLYATPVGACYTNREKLLVDIDEYYQIFDRVKSGDKSIQIRMAPYMVPFDKVDEFKERYGKEANSLDCMIYDKEIIQIDPDGNIFPCVLLLKSKKFVMGNANNKNELSRILQGDEKAWSGIMQMLAKQKEYTNKHGYPQTGCIGLCTAFKTKMDPRLGKGLPVCPCRTMLKEWDYGQEHEATTESQY